MKVRVFHPHSNGFPKIKEIARICPKNRENPPSKRLLNDEKFVRLNCSCNKNGLQDEENARVLATARFAPLFVWGAIMSGYQVNTP